jgi:hypothetical protein
MFNFCYFAKELPGDGGDITSLLYLLYKSKNRAEYLLIQKIDGKAQMKYFISKYEPFNEEYSLKKISQKIFAGEDIDFLMSYDFQTPYNKPLSEEIDEDLSKYIGEMFLSLFKKSLEKDIDILLLKYRLPLIIEVEYHNTNHITIKLLNNDRTLLKRFPLVTLSAPDDQYLEKIETEDFHTNFERIHLFLRNFLKIPDEYELSRTRNPFFKCLFCRTVEIVN